MKDPSKSLSRNFFLNFISLSFLRSQYKHGLRVSVPTTEGCSQSAYCKRPYVLYLEHGQILLVTAKCMKLYHGWLRTYAFGNRCS
jgi:hypothetical protein